MVTIYANGFQPGCRSTLGQVQIQGGGGDRPPKTYESNFFYYYFEQFRKQHSR